MQWEFAGALAGWVLLLVLPRWWLLAILALLYLVGAAQHAIAAAGDMIPLALFGVVPLLTGAFAITGALIVWGGKSLKAKAEES